MRREIVDSLLKSAKFHSLLITTLHHKLGNNLIPILDRADGQPLDLQDLMKRLTFDAICRVTLGFDPQSLSTESPHFSFEESFDLIMEVIMYRHCVPRSVWKLQGWFGIGKAGKFGAAVECVDRFLDDKIRVKMERCRSSSVDAEDGDFFGDVLFETERVFGRVEDCRFVREIVFTLMLAGRDTVAAGLTWFFWVVATNSDVEGKILEDMDQLQNHRLRMSLLHQLLSLSLFSLLLYICYLCISNKKKMKSRAVPNWPFLGILPALLWNFSQNQVHEFLTRILKLNGRTFFAGGPCLNLVVTCDPMNVHHILSKNFSNYPKGAEFKNILEPLGDLLINSDGETWKMRRDIIDSILKSAKFQSLLIRTLHQKMGNNLIPILDRAAAGTKPLDLQDLMKRLTFDAICIVTLGFDPQSLSTESPHLAFEESFDLIMEVILYRHCVPRSVWKLQGWFGIGKAGKFGAAVECIDRFLDDKIRVKMERCSNGDHDENNGDGDFFGEVLSETERVFGRQEDCKFVREIVFTLMLAGRDTVAASSTWFFWLVATNPDVEGKILEDMDQVTTLSGEKQRSFPSMEELNKMVYLQGAISETMRLYPPGPFNLKQSLEHDVLPSGHAINKSTRIMISIYSMGRMEEIWGDDCLEFKPERWVLQNDDEDGEKKNKIVHVPSYKLSAFLAGPRICPGRQIAFAEMKIVAYSVLSRFKIEVVEAVVPLASTIMFMKYGLKVRVSRRETSCG
ncbi:Alkane hydroxylase MAH1 [Linum grandiflorum]